MNADYRFYPTEHYGSGVPRPYRILPFRFMRWQTGEVLVVSDVGEYLFLDAESFREFVAHRLPATFNTYMDLKSKHFLWDSESTAPLDLLATKYRTKKSFLEGFTGLHYFVVTLRCDHSCHYCQVSRVTENRARFDMSEKTADKAVELMFRSPSQRLKVEFQGGEPLLNFELIKHIVERLNERNILEGRDIQYVVATNLAPLTDAMLDFFRTRAVFISTSLDGPELIHNANRPRRGDDSYKITVRNITRAREFLGRDRVAALMTTTELSLDQPEAIVDEYVRQGFDCIFLRPISPYGFAVRTGKAWNYTAEQFLRYYRAGLTHIIELNRKGVGLVEVYTQILLRKMLTPFSTGYVNLQSPSGEAIAAVAYNYDGDVYSSDEARMLAEMGDQSFRLGNVHENSYEEIFRGDTVKSLMNASILECLPGCSDCAFAPYCGADPLYHWATQGDPIGHRPTSGFCAKNMGVIRYLFDLLRSGDRFIERLFVAWATCGPLPEEEVR